MSKFVFLFSIYWLASFNKEALWSDSSCSSSTTTHSSYFPHTQIFLALFTPPAKRKFILPALWDVHKSRSQGILPIFVFWNNASPYLCPILLLLLLLFLDNKTPTYFHLAFFPLVIGNILLNISFLIWDIW